MRVKQLISMNKKNMKLKVITVMISQRYINTVALKMTYLDIRESIQIEMRAVIRMIMRMKAKWKSINVLRPELTLSSSICVEELKSYRLEGPLSIELLRMKKKRNGRNKLRCCKDLSNDRYQVRNSHHTTLSKRRMRMLRLHKVKKTHLREISYSLVS